MSIDANNNATRHYTTSSNVTSSNATLSNATSNNQAQAINVFVAGSLHLDLVIKAPHLPSLDETVVGESVHYVCGGKGGNQAVAAAKNGANTAMAGRIGHDRFGEALKQNLQVNNVDITNLQDGPTNSGMSVAISDSNGDYGAVIVSSSNLEIDTGNISIPDSTAIVMLQNEIPEAANIAVASLAKKNNTTVMLNAAPYRTMDASLIDLVDILVLNKVEASAFFNTTVDDAASAIAALDSAQTSAAGSANTIANSQTKAPDISARLLIITLGAGGLVYLDRRDEKNNPETPMYLPALPCKALSSHGAGDMFCGALASELAYELATQSGASLAPKLAPDSGTPALNVQQALNYAQAAAALLVSLDIESRDTICRRDVLSYLANHPATWTHLHSDHPE